MNASKLIRRGGIGLAARRAGVAAALVLACSLPAIAAPPAPSVTTQQWSWPQFKQSSGLTAGSTYAIANPGLPTIFAGSAQSTGFVPFGGLGAIPDGTELRGWLLGDIDNAISHAEPPLGSNNFRDSIGLIDPTSTTAGRLATGAIASWAAPDYAISNLRFSQTPVDTFDDTDARVTFTTGGFAPIVAAAGAGAINNEYYSQNAPTGTASWQFPITTAGAYSVWVNIPETGNVRAKNVTYTITGGATSNVIGPIDQSPGGFIAIGSVTTTTSPQTITVTVTDAAAADAGLEVDADAVQIRQSVVQTIDNGNVPAAFTLFGAPPFATTPTFNATANWAVPATVIDQNFYGTDYLTTTSPLVNRDTTLPNNGATDYVVWNFPVPVTGVYSLNDWFPSQNATSNGAGGIAANDTHITDAEYRVTIYDNTGALAFQTRYFTIDQTNGGFFLHVAGPFNIPGGWTLQVQLDNTTTNSLLATAIAPAPIVVADAMQLLPDNGFVSGTPTAVNITDYPELAVGYGGGGAPTGPAPAVAGTGGLSLRYLTPPLNPTTGQIDATQPLEQHGDWPAGTTIPIAQAVYVGRTENLQFNSTSPGFSGAGVAQASGALYALDGLNGNVIWKFGENTFTIDDTDPTFSTPLGAWSSKPVATPGTGTGYYGSDYLTTPADNSGTATATAQWVLPVAAGSAPAAYNIYAHFPTGNGETYISDAVYTVTAVAAGAETPENSVAVNQNTPGWVQVVNSTPGSNGSYALDNGNAVVLSNETAQTPINPPNIFAVADAVEFVPVNEPGAISGTPAVVRYMRVMTHVNAGLPVYEPRDCVIFGDSFGKVYCVDAAGNRDGDDTLLDVNGHAVSFDAQGNPFDSTTGQPYAAPFNFHPKATGTTHLYWVWQPNPADAGIVPFRDPVTHLPVVGQPNKLRTSAGAGDINETDSDANRDMPAPGPFGMNSPTVALASDTVPMTAAQGYLATVFIGNTNGYLYSIDARGAFDGLQADGVTYINDPKTFRFPIDGTVPTAEVNWWFNTGAGISYAPAYDPTGGAGAQGQVLVTTYDPTGNGHGRLYSINAVTGPVGNDGKDPVGGGAPAVNPPATFNYNTHPVSFWSFPDGYGTVADVNGAILNTAYHVVTSKVAGGLGDVPVPPLGDMAGSPTVESIDTSAQPQILVCANDPEGVGEPGSTTNGRVYAVNSDGTWHWSFPSTADDPNNSTAATTNNIFHSNTTAIAAFTEEVGELNLWASSSVVTGVITFPAAQPPANAVLTALADQETPMAYVGTLDGSLLALDLNGTNDTSRFIYYQPVTSDPIYSTPALLPGSSRIGSVATGSPEVGGVLFVNSSEGTLWEVEATPYVFNDVTSGTTQTVVNTDWAYDGPGGLSSPALAAFDVSKFNGLVGFGNDGGAIAATGNSEWVYSGSDQSFCYGFSPNTSSGGGNFSPGVFEAPGSIPPAINQHNPTRNVISRIVNVGSGPNQTTTPLNNKDWNDTIGPSDNPGGITNTNPMYDWGQTVYIQFYGVDPADLAGAGIYPHLLSLTFTVSEVGPGGKPLHSLTRTITPTTANPLTGAVNIPTRFTTAGPPAGPLYDTDTATAMNNVLTYPYQLGNGVNDQQTPGTKVKVSNIRMTVVVDSSGRTAVIQGTIDTGRVVNTTPGVGAPTLGLTVPIDQATFGILNPLAVTGAGKTADGSTAINIRELGPLGGVTDASNSLGGWNLWHDAAANGNYIPTGPPQGGSFGGTNGFDPTNLGTATQGVVQTTFRTVAVGIGEIIHGQASESATSALSDPNPSNGTVAERVPTNTVDAGYAGNLFLVTDRSALGSRVMSIDRLRMDALRLGWNDNSGQGGPGSAINMLSWDAAPLAWDYGSANTSLDYPDIPPGSTAPNLLQRTGTAGANTLGGIDGQQGGNSAELDQAAGTLAPSSQGSDVGDPAGSRDVYPMGSDVRVQVPRFQPANLESYQVVASSTQNPPDYDDGTPIQRINSQGLYVPEGYVSSARVFIDSNGNGRLDPGEAYRTVQVWIGVPVDMGMSIDEQQVDVGTVPPGFGVQAATGGTQTPWAPYTSATAHDSATSLTTAFAPYYQPLTVRDNGNVNLMNVHFDQFLAGPDVKGNNPDLAGYLQFRSDQDQTPSGLPLSLDNWIYDSMSLIPSYDTHGGLLSGIATGAGSFPSVLLRTSIDPDIYTPNQNEYDLAGMPPASRTVFNTTLHKARPGDAQGSVLAIPDQPHDQNNPAYEQKTQNTVTGDFPYSGFQYKPVISMAVPYGTPAGTYYGTVRAFEGTDPYLTINGTNGGSAGAGYSSVINGPTYLNVTNPGASGSATTALNNEGLSISNGSPMQYFTQPGTQLKVTVSESRFTDGPALQTHYPAATPALPAGPLVNLNLPNNTLAAVSSGGVTPDAVPADDLQPAAFRIGAAIGGLTSGTLGLLYVSDRDQINPAALSATAPLASGYDMFSSVLAPSYLGSQISAPTIANSSWWTNPADMTSTVALTPASGAVRSPYVLNDGVDVPMALWVTTAQGGSSQYAKNAAGTASLGQPVYTIREADITGMSSSGMTLTPAALTGGAPNPDTAIYSTTNPIYGLKAVSIKDSSGAQQLIVIWHTRLRGQASIQYVTAPISGGAIGHPPTASAVQTLPIPGSLSQASNPAPVARVICSVGPGGALTPFDPDATASNLPVNAADATDLDISYSGVQRITGETDIYTSRYKLIVTNGVPTLTQEVIVPQNVAAGPTLVQTSLTRSSSDINSFAAPLVNWAADPTEIALQYNGVDFIDSTLITSGGLHYQYDAGSGQLVYTKVSFPWPTTPANTTGTVYIDPFLGTVRFSMPPPNAGNPPLGTPAPLTALVLPLSSRVTLSSRVNTEPIALLDDAFKANDSPLPVNTNAGPVVHASREWFIYRKSGAATGDSAAVNSTLYYDTRRLTVDVSVLSPGTTSFHLRQAAAGGNVFDSTGFNVLVSNDATFAASMDVTARVDVDLSRARIYLPSYLEGLFVRVTVRNQNFGVALATPGGNAPVTVTTPSPVTWTDEPYVNAQNPTAVFTGERTVPMTTAVNESTPSAFMDPFSGLQPSAVAGQTVLTPHRLWLFWSSARNSGLLPAQGGSTGSDVYFETLDPKFSPDLD